MAAAVCVVGASLPIAAVLLLRPPVQEDLGPQIERYQKRQGRAGQHEEVPVLVAPRIRAKRRPNHLDMHSRDPL
mgnify:CR=1 FL=1